MQSIEVDVKLKSEVVETISIPIAESLSEAIEADTEVKVLAYYNQQKKAKLANECRAKYTPSKAGKKRLYALAYKLCDEQTHPENYAKMVETMGDYAAMQAFLESLFPEVEAALGGGTPALETEVDTEVETEDVQ